jgi:hypothetical protein
MALINWIVLGGAALKLLFVRATLGLLEGMRVVCDHQGAGQPEPMHG